MIAVGSDLGVKAQDRFYDGSAYYYQVNGWKIFSNPLISADIVYLVDVTRRTV